MLKKYNTLYSTILFLTIISVVYFATRLFNLTSLPIFTDEAIYIRWAQIANSDSSWRFISLTDGKQPSFIWLMMITLRIFSDPLIAGRIVSVIAGFFSILGIFFLTNELFKSIDKTKRISISLIASFLLTISPFALIYDRLAIYDSLVAALFIWSLYFQIRLIRMLRFDYSMVLGFILGGAVLTKSIGFLSIYLTPFLYLLFDFKNKKIPLRFSLSILYFFVAAVIAYAMYSVLRLSPYFHMINQKNSVFIYTIDYWFGFPISQKIELFISNSRGLFDWFLVYFSLPFVVLVILSFIFEKKLFKEKLVLMIFFLLPMLSLCFLGKTLYPRYVLFMVMPLFPLVAISFYELVNKIKNKLFLTFIIVICLFVPVQTSLMVLIDIKNAPIPKLDLEQLINGWPAGGGVKESIDFFENQSEKGEIMVGTQGTFGLMPAVFEIYLIGNKNVRINGFWPVEDNKIPELLIDYAHRIPTYFVFYQPCPNCEYPGKAPKGLDLIEIKSIKKGIGTTALTIYQVKPQK